ncbi:MAG: DUF4089 domain-containing protein [Gammaproteobacteria bacterium]
MGDSRVNLDELVKLTGVAIPAEYREGVATQLESLMIQAALVMSFPLEDETEPAPVFTP